MKHRIIMIMFTTIISLVFISCPMGGGGGDDNGNITPSDEKEWTIMVWLDGDNNLDLYAIDDYHEMEYGMGAAMHHDPNYQDKVNVIVQYDDSGTYVAEPGIYEVHPYNYSEHASYLNSLNMNNRIKDIGEPNMGSASELKAFIEYTKSNFPAKKYALILWNHGYGPRDISISSASRYICEDEHDSDVLFIGEIKDHLNAEHSVDFLGFDACLMSYLSVAYEFRPVSDDFGAKAVAFSPAREQEDGWDYTGILFRMNGRDDTDSNGYQYYRPDEVTPQIFAQIVAEEFEDASERAGETGRTLTAFDQSKVWDVWGRFNHLAQLLEPHMDYIEGVRDGTGTSYILGTSPATPTFSYFNRTSYDEWLLLASFDLYDFAARIEGTAVHGLVTERADALMTAIDDAIIYSYGGFDGFESGKHGLGFFFPDGDAIYDITSTYPTFWENQHWFNSLSQADYQNWLDTYRPGLNAAYGGLDFCASNGNGYSAHEETQTVTQTWFELLQYWYNTYRDPENYVNPNDCHPSLLF